MDIHSHHPMHELFAQLGLNNSPAAIDRFIRTHQLRKEDGELYRAIFWTPSQAQLIKQAIEADSDWSESVDELDVMLRR